MNLEQRQVQSIKQTQTQDAYPPDWKIRKEMAELKAFSKTVGVNDVCPYCLSGAKYKKCCKWRIDQIMRMDKEMKSKR